MTIVKIALMSQAIREMSTLQERYNLIFIILMENKLLVLNKGYIVLARARVMGKSGSIITIGAKRQFLVLFIV